jgi:FkbM family methyltransferase
MVDKSGEDWFRDDCYNTVWINHNINENSTVVELGGYKGRWTEKIKHLYNPKLFVLEPIKEFYEDLNRRFSSDKITVLNVGVSTENKFVEFAVKDDSTSQYIDKNGSTTALVELWSIEKLLELTGDIDLIQINIEGEEYPLLEYMIENDLIYKLKRLMIEFHFENKEGFPERRKLIQEKLAEKGYEKLWNYDWLFECWELKK